MPTVGRAGWTLKFTGFQRTLVGFDKLTDKARQVSNDAWFVGTVVEYAIYQHFGTRYLRGIPFLKMAIDRLSAKIAGDATLRGQLMGHAFGQPDGDLLQQLALMLEREVKLVITEVHESQERLIEFGVMRASFAAGPSIPAAAAASAVNVQAAGTRATP